MASQAIGPRMMNILLVIDLYLLQTGNEKTRVLWENLGWNHVLCWNGLSRTSNWREKWNFSQEFAQLQPNVAWQALLLKGFFLEGWCFCVYTAWTWAWNLNLAELHFLKHVNFTTMSIPRRLGRPNSHRERFGAFFTSLKQLLSPPN